MDDEIEKLKISIPKRLDSLNFSRFHAFIVFSLGISWILDGYEVSLLSSLSGQLMEDLNINDKEIGYTNSIYLSGCVIGSLLFGYLASRMGRKSLFSVTLLIYTLSIILTAFVLNKYMLYICRFLTGISVGGEYSSIFAAIDELIPKKSRGRIDLIIDGSWYLGSIISSILSYLTLHFISESMFSCRILFFFGALVSFPVIYMRKFIPESPRWLLYKGQYKDANRIVEEIELKCGKTNEEENLFLHNTNLQNQSTYNQITINKVLRILFLKYTKRFIYGLTLLASQAFFFNGVYYTYTIILQKFYNVHKDIVGLYLIPLAIASFCGPFIFGTFFDTWSRRKMIFLTFSISGIMLIISAFNFYLNSSLITMQILWFITFLFAAPAGSSAHMTISEIFPLEIRSQAMAIFFSLGLAIGGVMAPTIFGSFVNENKRNSIFWSYILIAVIMVFAGIISLIIGIDSENKSLEEISKMDEQKDEFQNYSAQDDTNVIN